MHSTNNSQSLISALLLSIAFVLLNPLDSNAQSKKEQIVELNQRVDSLNLVLSNVQSQLKTTEEQLHDRIKYSNDVDMRLSKCNASLIFTQDSLLKKNLLIEQLEQSISEKNQELQEKKLKMEQNQTKFILVKDSLAVAESKILEMNSQLKFLQAERDNLKLDLAQQNASISQKSTNEQANLIAELNKVPPLKGYKVNSKAQIEELTFLNFAMGDMGHIIFKNHLDEEYDFVGNLTDITLFLETDDNIEENMGFISNPKYVGKKFIVGWRNVKMTNSPADFIEELYEQYDEIIYLKQLN